MNVDRRHFMGAALTAGIASAQTGGSPAPAPKEEIPTRKAKVVKVFKGPDPHPNALEATKDALWIGGQVSEIAYKVDWKTHKVLHQVQTESHNTSGMAVGGGFIWMSANGGVSNRRPPRPTDSPKDEIVQCDMETGKTIRRYAPPWPSGSHGIVWSEQTNTLWVTAVGLKTIAELDPKDNFRILHMIPVQYQRVHGLDFDNGALWGDVLERLPDSENRRGNRQGFGTDQPVEGRPRSARNVHSRRASVLLRCRFPGREQRE
jgi:hypothetical protein